MKQHFTSLVLIALSILVLTLKKGIIATLIVNGLAVFALIGLAIMFGVYTGARFFIDVTKHDKELLGAFAESASKKNLVEITKANEFLKKLAAHASPEDPVNKALSITASVLLMLAFYQIGFWFMSVIYLVLLCARSKLAKIIKTSAQELSQLFEAILELRKK